LGFSPTGEAFNLSLEDLACATAIALDADKLIFLTEHGGVRDAQGDLLSEITESAARTLLLEGGLPGDVADTLRHALRACDGGVARAQDGRQPRARGRWHLATGA
jgi:amino-acid N-acetyltransferase